MHPNKIKGILLLIVLVSTCAYSASRDSFSRSFWLPIYHGKALNYCSTDGKQCGLQVASRYCQMMGYEKADKATIAYNIGVSHYINSAGLCKDWRCNGFKTIRCIAKITHKPPKETDYRLARFSVPRFNNYRVDWCYDGQKQCGKRAAFSFCRHLGYMSVKSFVIEKHIGITQAIGNQKICLGQSCQGFKEIICFR